MELVDFCNLGYSRCPRLPQEREADAVRFGVALEKPDSIVVQYVFEHAHAPGAYGTLEYSAGMGVWLQRHPDSRVQRQAECFVESYFARKNAPEPEIAEQAALALK
jgi:hypothetical protein